MALYVIWVFCFSRQFNEALQFFLKSSDSKSSSRINFEFHNFFQGVSKFDSGNNLNRGFAVLFEVFGQQLFVQRSFWVLWHCSFTIFPKVFCYLIQVSKIHSLTFIHCYFLFAKSRSIFRVKLLEVGESLLMYWSHIIIFSLLN